MSVKFEFSISDKSFERLCYLKNKVAGENDKTFNEYAAELLEDTLRRLCPRVPENDE